MRFFDTSAVLYAVSFFLSISAPTGVNGEIVFTNPVAGRTIAANTAFEVTWRDNDEEPVSAAAGTFTLTICVGSNAQIFPLFQLVTGQSFAAANGRASVTIPSSLGANGSKPVYFLQMTWSSPAGMVVNYSDRFTMRGMLGIFSAAQEAAHQVGDTDRPPAEHPEKVLEPNDPQGLFDVPFSEQTGPTRYAPMQPRPGSVITAKNTRPLYPTSAYTIYTTKGGAPSGATTITAPRTYGLTTVVNDASPAPMPDDDMERFLNRWKD